MPLPDNLPKSAVVSIDHATQQSYLTLCPTFVKSPDEEWIELRCSFCGINANDMTRQLLRGIRAFQIHADRAHSHKRSRRELFKTFKYRTVPVEEVQAIIDKGYTGIYPVEVVAVRKSQAQAATSEPQNSVAGTPETVPSSWEAEKKRPTYEDGYECIVKHPDGFYHELACFECNVWIPGRSSKHAY